MRFFLLATLLLPLAARAEDLTIRPFLGVGLGVGEAGGSATAQIGIRFSPVLLRLSLDMRPDSAGPKGFVAGGIRAGWVHALSESHAVVVGAGLMSVGYGFIFDSPTAHITALAPEVGMLFGQNRWFGRVMAGVQAFVPLEHVARPHDYAGQQIGPPILLGTLVLSI